MIRQYDSDCPETNVPSSSASPMKLNFHKASSELIENGAGRKKKGSNASLVFAAVSQMLCGICSQFNIHLMSVKVFVLCVILICSLAKTLRML